MKDLKLTKKENQKWINNLLLFLSPVAIIYIVAVVGLIQANSGEVKLTDFVPNSFVLGSIALYILNTLLDYLRKIR